MSEEIKKILFRSKSKDSGAAKEERKCIQTNDGM